MSAEGGEEQEGGMAGVVPTVGVGKSRNFLC